jgi:hypothetical protein
MDNQQKRSLNWSTLLAISLVIFGIYPDRLMADENVVSLMLSKSTAERGEPYTTFKCEVTLNNEFKKDLVVLSHFGSAFDGIELVVTSTEGKTLYQISSTYYLAPGAEEMRVPVKPGISSKTLVFSVPQIPNELKTVKVRLVGILPKCDYERILSTETLVVEIKPKP